MSPIVRNVVDKLKDLVNGVCGYCHGKKAAADRFDEEFLSKVQLRHRREQIIGIVDGATEFGH